MAWKTVTNKTDNVLSIDGVGRVEPKAVRSIKVDDGKLSAIDAELGKFGTKLSHAQAAESTEPADVAARRQATFIDDRHRGGVGLEDDMVPDILTFTLGTPSGLAVPISALTVAAGPTIVGYAITTDDSQPAPGASSTKPTSWTAPG